MYVRSIFFFFQGYGDHRDLHVLTHSFPTRRSSDLDLEDREDPEHQRVGLGARIHASNDPVGRGDGAVQLRRAALRPPHPERVPVVARSEEHTSELQSLMRISYAVFCLKKKTNKQPTTT